MKKRWYLYTSVTLTLFMLVVLLGISCKRTQLDVTGDSIGTDGVPVMVDLNLSKVTFNTPSSGDIQTRGDGINPENEFSVQLGVPTPYLPSRASSGSTPLYNLCVFQFGADKKLRKITKVSDSDEPILENSAINIELYTGINQTLYIMALGKQYPNEDFSGITTIEELEAFKFSFYRFESGVAIARINKEEDIPYAGFQPGLEIIKASHGNSGAIKSDPISGFTGAIKVSALVTKVTFNFSYTAAGFTPSFITLNNMPSQFAIKNTPTSFVNPMPIDLSSVDLGSGKRAEYSWYMPSNLQGVVSSITKESERFFYTTNAGGTKGNAPRDATYLSFWALDDNLADNYALYYIFLGGNTTNDFNLFQSSHYIYRTDMNTAVNDNNRVLIKKIAKTIDFASSHLPKWFNVGNSNGAGYDFDAHPSMRPMEITALRGSVKIEILSSSDGGKTFTTPSYNSSWLKLSTYPNYTEALNAFNSGSNSGLSTSLILTANVPGLFKLYLYNDEYEQYTTANPATSPLKRSMYIRMTFFTGTGGADDYLFRMDQRPAYYIGLFGGEYRNDDGSYPMGLAFESMREVQRYLSYYKGFYDMPRGAYNAPSASLDGYDVENAVCGRNATVALAENPKRLSFYLTSPVAKEPWWVGGVPDLYQYKYHTLDGFGVRSCYDKNRDINGNGKIDKDEMIWYLPSYFQNLSINFNYYSVNNAALSSADLFAAPTATITLGRYSTTMFSESNANFNSHYTLFNHIPLLKNSVKDVTARNHERCVRDVAIPTDPSLPKGPTVSVEDNFAVINATGFMKNASEDRVTSRLRPDDRLTRHLISDVIAQRVSAKFRVASEDIATQMKWAEAAGFDKSLNSKVLTEVNIGVDAKNTGCAQLPLAGGAKPWRLPTGLELILIDMMDEIMVKTSATTGYKALYIFAGGSSDFYWSATELDKDKVYVLVNANSPNQKRAARYLIGESYTLKEGVGTPAMLGRSRCIQDLHP